MRDGRYLIAVVDDEEPVRRALGRMLRASRYDVLDFGSAQAFLDSLRAMVPDCVLLDLQMPRLTGNDVQRAMNKAHVAVPVIVMTAHDRPHLREECLAEGAIAYFSKPLRREAVIPAIDAAIQDRLGRA